LPAGHVYNAKEGTHESPSTLPESQVTSKVKFLFLILSIKLIAIVSLISRIYAFFIDVILVYAITKGFVKFVVEKSGIKSLNCNAFFDIVFIEFSEI
jgi:hypothetical protein